jgi:hypothetical protein
MPVCDFSIIYINDPDSRGGEPLRSKTALFGNIDCRPSRGIRILFYYPHMVD